MNSRRPRGGALATFIIDEAFKTALSRELAALAREIQARDGCTDNEAISRAMKEYDRLVLEAQRKRNELKDAQERKRREDAMRARGEPTLKVSLGDVAGLAALRAKLPPGK